MADRADGSIRIDTKLDSDKFEKGSNRLMQAIQSLKQKILSVSGQLDGTFGFAQTRSALEDTARSTQDFRDDVEGVAQAMGAFDMADTFIQADDALDMLSRKMQEFAERTYQMEDGSVVLGKHTEQYQMMADAYEQLKEKLDSTDESQKNMVGNYQDMVYFAVKFDETVSSMDSALTLEQTADIVAELRRQMEAFGDMDFSIAGKLMKGADTAGFKEMQAAVEAVEQKLEEMAHTPAWNEMMQKWQMMPTVSGMVKDASTSALTAITTKAIQAGAAISAAMRDPRGAVDRLGATAVKAAGQLASLGAGPVGAAMAAAAAVAKAVTVVAALAAAVSKLIASSSGAAKAALVGGLALAAVAAAAMAAARGVAKIAALGSGPAKAALAAIASGARKAAGSLAQMAKNAAIAPFTRLGSALSGIFNRNKAMNGGFKASLTTMLKYGLGIRSLYFLFNKLRNALMDGVKAMMQYDSGFAGTVNSFKASLETLKNSFAAAFAPIAQIVLPILTRLINALSQAISYVGMFIASLTGQSTFKRAVAQQEAAADAANDAADAYGNEADAAKKAKKTVASFDELHRLDDNSDADKSKSGLANADKSKSGLAGGAFEDVPIDSKIDDLAKKLKEMWDLADFTELGRRLGEGLKNLLDSIPWDYIQAMAAKLGESLATFLNGFLEAPGLFLTIGKTIAEAINTLFSFLYGFVSNLHWDSLGYALRDGILGLLQYLDWDLIYATFSTAGIGLGQAIDAAFNNPEIWTAIFEGLAHQWEALLLFIDGLISTPDWGSIARNIGTGLNAGVEAFPWDLLAKTLSDALNMVFDFAYNFLTTFDFYSFGAHIGKAITDTVGNIDWAKGGSAIAAAINGLYSFLNGVVENTDFEEVGRSVIDAIGGFFEELDWGNGPRLGSNILVSLFNFLKGALEEVNWVEVPGKIFEKLDEFMSGFDWRSVAGAAMGLLCAALLAALKLGFGLLVAVGGGIYNAFKSIADGGLQGIIDGFAGIGKWIVAHIFDPFIDGFKKAFGINSPSKELEDEAIWIPAGILNGILSGLKNVGGWLKEHVGEPIINGVKSLFGIGSGTPALESTGEETSGGLKSGIESGMSGIADWIKTNVVDRVTEPMEDGLGINGAESSVFGGYGTAMTSSLEAATDRGKRGAIDVVEGMAAAMSAAFSSIDWSSIGSSICSGIYNGLYYGWDWLTRTASNLAADIFNAACNTLGIHSPSKKFHWIAEMMTEGMAQGIDDTQQAAVKSTQALAQAVTEGAQEAAPKISLEAGIDGVDGVLTTFADKVTNSFAAMIARMEEIAAGSSFYIPSAAAGTTVPYSARVGGPADSASGMEELADRIDQASSRQVTRRDLEEVMETMLARYLNIEFYIGEEQVARAANAGNARINRRYSALEG